MTSKIVKNLKKFLSALPFSRFMLVSIVASFGVSVTVYFLSIFVGFHIWSLLTSLLTFLISMVLILSIFIYQHADMIRQIRKLDLYPSGFKAEIERSVSDIRETLDGKKSIKDNLTMDRYTEMFFASGKGAYIGIESSLPSEFIELYPRWLTAHEEYLKKLPPDQTRRGGRVLIINSIKELRDDYFRNPENFDKFIKWHKQNNVRLLYILKGDAKKIKKKYEEPEVTDVALWEDSFAVTFQRVNEEIKIKWIDKENNETLFNNYWKYVHDVSEIAQPVPFPDLPIVEKELAQNWKGYTGTLKERAKIHEFIYNILEEYKNYEGKILDAAAGIGNEVIYLLKNDFDVEANEADTNFYNELVNNINNDKDLQEKGVNAARLHIYRSDWRKISKELPYGFSAILLMGNSLCMVLEKEERLRCLKEFHSLLKPCGKLIVDERNFPKILKRIENGEKVYGRSVMYPGKDITCEIKLSKTDKGLIFEFFKNSEHIGDMKVAYIEEGELMDMLKQVGFKDIEVFSDLNKKGKDKDADFYTYVAVK